jgi:fermentation-respiration switch protein FrsA (DUF1100 family)
MPVRWFIKDTYNSLAKIAAVSSDILILHGDADTLIPLAQARELAAKATAKNTLKIYAGENHNDLNFNLVGADVVEFIEKQ